MTAASNNSAPLGDWEDRGLPALRAIFAEGVTAEFANSKYPGEATWYGNQTRGLDIESPNGRADAKSVRIENGEVVLARRNAQPFDPGKVDHIALVHLEANSGVTIDLANRSASLSATAVIHDAWIVPVTDLNALMPQHADDEPTWRNVHIPIHDLTRFRVV